MGEICMWEVGGTSPVDSISIDPTRIKWHVCRRSCDASGCGPPFVWYHGPWAMGFQEAQIPCYPYLQEGGAEKRPRAHDSDGMLAGCQL